MCLEHVLIVSIVLIVSMEWSKKTEPCMKGMHGMVEIQTSFLGWKAALIMN
jgi:hypothetical protein